MGGLTGWAKRLAVGAAALLALAQPMAIAASAPERAAAEAALPRPAIWLVEDEDTKIYLFGTLHLFPASLRWRSAALERVIAQADELVMETPEASLEEMQIGERMFERMEMGEPVPILERVSPELRPRLRQLLSETGLAIELFDRMESWTVAFVLTGFQMIQQLSGEEGEIAMSSAEDELAAAFRDRDRPISGVETVDEQLSVFASLPADAQRSFLESVLVEGPPEAMPTTEQSDRSWVSGDVEAIAAEMQAMPPELYDALLTRRNRNWTQWLVRRLARPGTVLFAVGAGHLAGPDSVQRMLAGRGLRVRRVN